MGSYTFHNTRPYIISLTRKKESDLSMGHRRKCCREMLKLLPTG